MSFSGRLSIVDSEPHESIASTSNSIIPLSIAQRINMESPSPPAGVGVNLRRSNNGSHQKQNGANISLNNLHDNNHIYHKKYKCDSIKSDIPSSTVKNLAKELIETRAHLNLQQIQVRKMRDEHESQLKVLCRQLLNLESGLRKSERELKMEIQQKDKKIQEQENIIEFLVKKSNTKCRDIKDLCEEAVAKIPQIQPVLDSVEVVSDRDRSDSRNTNSSNIQRRLSDTIIVNVKHQVSQNSKNEDDLEVSKKQPNNRVSTNKQDLTSIYEYSDSQNDNDSDSAIIIDDRLMSSSLQRSQYKGISRSISDVVSCISSTPLKDVVPTNDNDDEDNVSGVNVKQARDTSSNTNNPKNKNIASIHLAEGLDMGGNEKGQNLPYPPSTCITSLLGNNLNTWYSNEACGSLSPPLLLMRKHQSRMTTHLDTRVNSCSSEEEEEEDEMFVGDDMDKTNKEDDKSPFASANYRGFLLRHGSYERYKSRSLYQQQCNNKDDNFNQRTNNHNETSKMNVQKRNDQANLTTSLISTETTITPLNYCTLPRRSKSVTKLNRQKTTNSQKFLDENQVHISNMSASSSTLIIVNQKSNGEECNRTTTNNNKNKFSWPKINIKDKKADVSLSTQSLNSQHYQVEDQHSHNQPQQIQIKHKNFMKPRDVKNRSTQKQKQHQQQQQKSQEQKWKQENNGKKIKESSSNNSPSLSKTFTQNIEKYIKKNGSVYCSLIMQETDLNSQSFA